MEVFIRRLPESVTRLDLIHFLSNATRNKWDILRLRRRPSLVDCGIYKLVNPDDSTVEFHGIAHVEPESAARSTIGKLDGTYLKGKLMEVRAFVHRTPRGERRRPLQTKPSHPIYEERRKENRRRDNLVIEELHAGSTRSSHSLPQPGEPWTS